MVRVPKSETQQQNTKLMKGFLHFFCELETFFVKINETYWFPKPEFRVSDTNTTTNEKYTKRSSTTTTAAVIEKSFLNMYSGLKMEK